MSGYLNNLVLRTRSLAPVVKPRLASAFETPIATRVVLPVAPAEETILDVGPVMRSAESPGVPVTQVQTPVREQPAEPKVTPVEVMRVEPHRVASMTEVRTVETHRVERISESITPQPRIIKPAVITPEQVNAVPLQTKPMSDAPEVKSGYWKNIEQRVRQTVKEELPSTTQSKEQLAKPIAVVQPHIVPQVRRERTSAPPSSSNTIIVKESPLASTPSPEITVTIGRVDVRAVMAPTTQPARRENPAITTPSQLDQYLKARSEGRR
jgi:hypothetical protein